MFLLLLLFSSSYAADSAELVTNGGGDETKNSAAFLGKVEIIFKFSSSALVLSSRTLWSSLQEAALPSLERRHP